MNKFNEHILLIMRWIQNSDSVSEEELEASYNIALYTANRAADTATRAAYAGNYSAYYAADTSYAAYAAAKYAYYSACNAAYYASSHVAKNWLSKTEEYLNEYFKLTNEDRKAYEERAKYLNIVGAKNE